MSIIASYIVPHPPLIVKEIGRGEEKKVLKTIQSYEEIAKEIAKLEPETVIITSPHAPYYSDYFYMGNQENIQGDFQTFGAKEVVFHEQQDMELMNAIEIIAKENHFPTGKIEEKELDHGTMVPLYFLRKYYKKGKIIRIGLSTLPLIENYNLGMIIKKAVDKLNRKVVFVASGDLSHKLQTYGPYGFIKEGPIYDQIICDMMKSGNFMKLLNIDKELLEKSAECGHRSFTIMAGALDGLNVETNFLSHEDQTGVGYGLCKIYPKEKSKEREFKRIYLENKNRNIEEIQKQEDEYVELARNAIESYIKENKVINIPKTTSKELLKKRSGVFVSIHKWEELRGCIGTILPITSCIAEEIIENAISAATKDNRFSPITTEELPWLEINVDVLTKPETINNKNELDVKKYGVIVTKGSKRGVLLPDLEGIDAIDQQISIAKRKANISEEEEVELQRFEVIRHI